MRRVRFALPDQSESDDNMSPEVPKKENKKGGAVTRPPIVFKHFISDFHKDEKSVRARIQQRWVDEGPTWPQHIQDEFKEIAENLKFARTTIAPNRHQCGKQILEGKTASWGNWMVARCIWSDDDLDRLAKKMMESHATDLFDWKPSGNLTGVVGLNKGQQRNDERDTSSLSSTKSDSSDATIEVHQSQVPSPPPDRDDTGEYLPPRTKSASLKLMTVIQLADEFKKAVVEQTSVDASGGGPILDTKEQPLESMQTGEKRWVLMDTKKAAATKTPRRATLGAASEASALSNEYQQSRRSSQRVKPQQQEQKKQDVIVVSKRPADSLTEDRSPKPKKGKSQRRLSVISNKTKKESNGMEEYQQPGTNADITGGAAIRPTTQNTDIKTLVQPEDRRPGLTLGTGPASAIVDLSRGLDEMFADLSMRNVQLLLMLRAGKKEQGEQFLSETISQMVVYHYRRREEIKMVKEFFLDDASI